MQFNIQQYVSNFVAEQFPDFYKSEGANFILFMEAYYEWMESEGNPIYQARQLLNYRDIDNTLDEFLSHFQAKYLYGIPFNVIINKRFLLKHVLDVYRSKGSIQCYKLLFKLIYDQDVDVYLPGVDILKASDGTWVEPRYLELSPSVYFNQYAGQQIVGLSSGTTAVVESCVRESINQTLVNVAYISNITPPSGTFNIGEKIVPVGDTDNAVVIDSSSVVVGSLSTFNVLNGGQGFAVGDILKVVHTNPANSALIMSDGIDGLVKVTALQQSLGYINFLLLNGGTGITANASTFVYNNPIDTTGSGSQFSVGSLAYESEVSYNADMICDYANIELGAATYGFPANPTGNATSTIGSLLTIDTALFGTIGSLDQINSGSRYTQDPYTFVQSDIVTKAQVGSVSYSTASSVITGTNTNFTALFSGNNVLVLQANSSNGATAEQHVILSIANATSMTIWDTPVYNSTPSATYKLGVPIFPANFAPYESEMYTVDGSEAGLNANVASTITVGNNIISNVVAIDSGRGYIDGAMVYAYLYNGLNAPTIRSGGIGYSNGNPLVFSGGATTSIGVGYVTTNANGTITGTVLTFGGSGYDSIPVVSVQSSTGSGASLYTTLAEYNTFSILNGKTNKTGIGVKRGYWSTTRGFLNSNKYIQDSYFYQDFSYQLKVATTLASYRNILYDTFHPAGSEMFGQYQLIDEVNSSIGVLYD